MQRRALGLAGYRRGHHAEFWAACWLRICGYRILARRWRCAAGEVDLIAWKRGTLIAVEVKARPTFEQGLAAIRPQQQARLQAALQIFAAQKRLQPQALRFDALVVVPRRLPYHLHDAWRPEW